MVSTGTIANLPALPSCKSLAYKNIETGFSQYPKTFYGVLSSYGFHFIKLSFSRTICTISMYLFAPELLVRFETTEVTT